MNIRLVVFDIVTLHTILNIQVKLQNKIKEHKI